MSGYNLGIEVNDEEYATALRIDDSVDHLEAMKRAFWAVKKEFYPEGKDEIRAKQSFKYLIKSINYIISAIDAIKDARYEVHNSIYDPEYDEDVLSTTLAKERLKKLDKTLFSLESWVTYLMSTLEITEDDLNDSRYS